MLPNTTIVIGKDGTTRMEVNEKSDQCGKISELAKMAGKVISDDDKEHTPVFQDVHQTSN
jgi:hypothetical protein